MAVAVHLTEDAARVLTDEVKADAAALWEKLLRLYKGGAHAVLGYSSWAAYCAAEFDWSDATAYRLLGAANVVAQLPIGSPRPATESVARELVPVLREAPDNVPEVWGEVVAEHGPEPTAAQVREAVEQRVGPRRTGQQQKLVGGIAEKARHITDLAPHLDVEAIHALPEEERTQWKQELSAARTVLSRLIGAL